uniref:Cytochrome c oxidase subunit NDUFA4 n=1 Tax=Eptatretus burgeri TaxID=7764 RepID=A0A8C4PZC8_EPTBU
MGHSHPTPFGAAAYMLRIALFSPDCSWDKRKNPEPWNKLKPTDQYKASREDIKLI